MFPSQIPGKNNLQYLINGRWRLAGNYGNYGKNGLIYELRFATEEHRVKETGAEPIIEIHMIETLKANAQGISIIPISQSQLIQ